MQALTSARTRAGQVRAELALAGQAIEWPALVEYCERVHALEVVKVAAVLLGGAEGDLSKVDGLIRIDEALSPVAALATLAHELGHLELHSARMDDPTDTVDPIMASVYADRDGIGIARYSPRMREEVEAEAFAATLLCPPEEALAHWVADPLATCESVAARFGVSVESAQAQLASGLYLRSLGEPAVASARPLPEPDADQLAAIHHSINHALVDAGPGTGKTATLVHRARYLVETLNAPPEHILIVTFSNEAAAEVRSRLTAALGAVAARMTIQTFHAFGAELLHNYHAEVGRHSTFALLDDEAQLDFISRLAGRREVRPLVNIRTVEDSVERLARLCDFCSGRLVTADALDDAVAAWSSDDGDEVAHEKALAFAAFYRTYEHEKAAANVVDFADLIRLPVELLMEGGEPRNTVQAKYQHVLVDEFQDVTPGTARLIAELASEHTPVWVVGDARQAIYRFLGASAENITDFKSRFPSASEYTLRTNYRADPAIVEAANELATLLENHNATGVDEKWTSTRMPGSGGMRPAVSFAVADSDIDEAHFIVTQVQRLLVEGVAADEIAILTRRNEDVRRVALLLAAEGVRVSANNLLSPEGLAGDLVALTSLADDRSLASAVRAAVAVSRERLSPAETNELINAVLNGRALPAGSSVAEARTLLDGLMALSDGSRNDADAFDLLCRLLFNSPALLRPLLSQPERVSTRLHLSEIASVLALAISFRAGSREEPRDRARLRFAASARKRLARGRPAPVAPEQTPGAVRVMTCHAAKGLEFPFVFVAGQSARVDQDSYPELPRKLRPAEGGDSAQADALLFVAVTRAQRSVLISRAKSPRGVNGRSGREPVALLSAWNSLRASVPVQIASSAMTRADSVVIPWRPEEIGPLNVSSLSRRDCGLQRYLEGVWRLRFPEAASSPYTAFFDAVRRSLELLLARSAAAGSRIDALAAVACFDEVWSALKIDEHAHKEMYEDIGRSLLSEISQTFPLPNTAFTLDPAGPITLGGGKVAVRLGLVGTVVTAHGFRIAVGVTTTNPETSGTPDRVNWSALDDPRALLSLSLACTRTGAAERVIVSVPKRAALLHQDSKQKGSLTRQDLAAEAEVEGFLRGTTSVSPSQCGRCRVRLVCPWWLELSVQDAPTA